MLLSGTSPGVLEDDCRGQGAGETLLVCSFPVGRLLLLPGFSDEEVTPRGNSTDTSQRLEIGISTAEGTCFLKNTSLARPLSVPPTLTASTCAGGLRFQQGLPGFFKFPFLSSLR